MNALSFSSVSVSGVTEVSAESKDHEKKIELNLTANEQSLMMSDDIIQCLFSAIENWELMREKASTSNLPVSKIIHNIVLVKSRFFLPYRCLRFVTMH